MSQKIGFIWSIGINFYWSLVGTLGEMLSMELDHFQYERKTLNGLTLIQKRVYLLYYMP